MTHTPTPWETRELLNGDQVISQKGAATAHTTVHVWNGKEEKATAQFIIAACNAHDELVRVLKTILIWDDGNLPGDILEDARNALAKAKEVPQ